MMNSLGELVSVIDRLMARIDALEGRISALEHRSPEAHVAATERNGNEQTTRIAPKPAPALMTAEHPLEQVLSRSGPGIAPAVGKVFLGVAGAYILRALAESGALPQMAIVAVALAYAATWLVWSARASVDARFAGAAYAATAALILSPMLWELTVRFKVLPDGVTAVLLAAFSMAGAALGWKQDLSAITWISSLAAVLTGLALLINTRDPAPFTIALLAIAVCIEAASCFGHCLRTRAIVAAALDLGVLAVLAVYTAEQGLPPEYRPIGKGLLLVLFAAPLLIYGLSTGVRSVARRRGITVFEIAQTTTAFVLAWFGVLRVTQGGWSPALGTFAVVVAAGGYAAAFSRFRHAAHARDHHVFATWGASLALAGGWLLFPSSTFVAVLGLGALCATFLATRYRRFTVAFQGAVLLTVASFRSGFLIYSERVLLGGFPPNASFGVVFTAVVALACYGLVWRFPGDGWQCRLVRLLLGANAFLAVTVFPVSALVSVVWHGAPAAAALAVVRTLVLCGAALLLGVLGARRERIELVWLAYAAMAVCTLKLLLEDLRSLSTGAMAIALFAYGLVWVLLPRFVRGGQAR
jgi:hypothetical protein